MADNSNAKIDSRTKSENVDSPGTTSWGSSGHTGLTPESDSEDEGLDVEIGELGVGLGIGMGGSYKMGRVEGRGLIGKDGLVGESGDESESEDELKGALDNDEDEERNAEEGYGDERGYGRRRRRRSSVQSYQLYTPDEERAVIRKFDKNLVLFVALLYMLSFLDRSNIGLAKIAGLDLDLDLDSNRFEWILWAFYITYILFEWMSILWKIIPAHIYVTIIVLSWGIIASLQSIATSFTSLLILRALLGIGEAGFTGIPFYLSFFFKREELALRTGYFISAAPLATSFAATLATGITKLGEWGPIASWRLLFLIEGFPSVLVAVVAWRVIPDSPSTAHFLTKREKKVASLRLRKEKGRTEDGDSTAKKASGIKMKEIVATVTDPKSYLIAFMFFFANMAFSSMPLFSPTIIHEMHHSILATQALTAPPYILSFILVIATAYTSDRFQTRYPFILFSSLLSFSGYLFIFLAGHWGWGNWWRYAGLYPATVGFFCVVTIVITWGLNNGESEGGRGTGFAMLQFVGQCGPLVGTRLYPEGEGPLYVRGMLSCAAAMLMVAILATILRFYLVHLNKRNEREYGGVAGEAGVGLVDNREGQNEKFGRRFVYML